MISRAIIKTTTEPAICAYGCGQVVGAGFVRFWDETRKAPICARCVEMELIAERPSVSDVPMLLEEFSAFVDAFESDYDNQHRQRLHRVSLRFAALIQSVLSERREW